MPAEPVIKTEKLRVIYNQGKSNEVRSLDGIDVSIYPQEYVIIHGPSGCGKSTLLYSMAGLQSPTYGEVTVSGKNISQMKNKEKVELHQTGIGLIFQAFYLISSINVIDNVCLPKVFHGDAVEERKQKATELLRRFGIVEQANKFPSQLSGGQKQRVAIARSLVNDPQVIMADEPVGNLDSESAQNVLDILKELNEVDKKTVIMVTHNSEHLHYADRIIHMKDGVVISEEVNYDKRPKDVIKEELTAEPVKVSPELRVLMRAFENLTPRQMGVLLIPFKAKQLLSHVLSELTEEQISAAENFLKELLFQNINIKAFQEDLDLDYNKGGAGWNKKRTESFSDRVQKILEQTEIFKKEPEKAAIALSDYLISLFDMHLTPELIQRFRSFVKLRVENKLDRYGLEQRLDAPKALGGVGLYKPTSERVVRELEIIMLLKYSA